MRTINLQELCDKPTWKIETDFCDSYGCNIMEKINWIFAKIQQIADIITSSMGCGNDHVFIVVNDDDPLFGNMCKLVEEWNEEEDEPRRPFEPLGKIMLTQQEIYRSEVVPKGSFLVVADYDKTYPEVQAGLLTLKNWVF